MLISSPSLPRHCINANLLPITTSPLYQWSSPPHHYLAIASALISSHIGNKANQSQEWPILSRLGDQFQKASQLLWRGAPSSPDHQGVSTEPELWGPIWGRLKPPDCPGEGYEACVGARPPLLGGQGMWLNPMSGRGRPQNAHHSYTTVPLCFLPYLGMFASGDWRVGSSHIEAKTLLYVS